MQCKFFALQGIAMLTRTIGLVQKRLNPGLKLTGVISCMYDARKGLAREVMAEIDRHFGGTVFKARIRANVRLAESPSHGKTIFEYAPDSYGAQDYMALAREVAGLPPEPPAVVKPAPAAASGEGATGQPAPVPAAVPPEPAAAKPAGEAPKEPAAPPAPGPKVKTVPPQLAPASAKTFSEPAKAAAAPPVAPKPKTIPPTPGPAVAKPVAEAPAPAGLKVKTVPPQPAPPATPPASASAEAVARAFAEGGGGAKADPAGIRATQRVKAQGGAKPEKAPMAGGGPTPSTTP
jgi:hypothetical protein